MFKTTRILISLLLFGVPAVVSAQGLPIPVSATSTPLVCSETGTATVTIDDPPAAFFDVVLAIEQSTNFDSVEFEQVKSFAIEFVSRLKMGPGGARVGLVTFDQLRADRHGLVSDDQASVIATIASLSQPLPQTPTAVNLPHAHHTANQLMTVYVPYMAPQRFTVIIGRGSYAGDPSVLQFYKGESELHGIRTMSVQASPASAEAQQQLLVSASDPALYFQSAVESLPSVLGATQRVLPAVGVDDFRLDFTVDPRLIAVSAATSDTGSTVSMIGNSMVWQASSRPSIPAQLSLTLRRTGVTGAIDLFSSWTYLDSLGRQATFQNATVSATCDTTLLEAQIQSLTGQVASLTDEVTALRDQNAELEEENDALRSQLPDPSAPPAGTGAMTGSGQVVAGRSRMSFDLLAKKLTDGNVKLGLAFKVCEQLPEQADDDLRCLLRPHNFSVSYFTAVQFSDDLEITPSPDPAKQGVDTMVLSGVAAWNGVDGHRFTVRATDRGDQAGPNDDTFAIDITAPDGTVVFSVAGALAIGNLETN